MDSNNTPVQYVQNSREYDITTEYLKLNTEFGYEMNYKAKHVYDYLFEFILKQFKPELICKENVNKELKNLSDGLSKHQLDSREILTIFRNSGEIINISFDELIESLVEIHPFFLWSPNKALIKIFEEFYNNGYGVSYMSEYFKDESRIKKIIKYGHQELTNINDLDVCLLSFLINDNIKHHKFVKISNRVLNDKLSCIPVNLWVDYIIEHGLENNLKGIDMEFKNYLVNFSKLDKFWDIYKSQQLNKNKLFTLNGLKEISDNELCEIFAGNYQLVPNIKNSYNVDLTEANKLICNWKLFNSFTSSRQQQVKTFLMANLNRMNNYIQRGSEKIYRLLNKARKTNNYERLLNTYVKNKSYYNQNNNQEIMTLQNTINTRMNSSKFDTIADAMEFVIHQYIPILRNYKNSPNFNSLQNNLLLNSDVLSVVGIAEYLPNEHETVRIVKEYIEKPAEIKYIEKPAEIRYIERPAEIRYINLRGGDNDNTEKPKSSNESSGLDKYIKELVSFQENFNRVYMLNWRDILNKLGNIREQQVTNENLTTNIITKFERILVNCSKTTYYLSGVYKARDLNKEYTISVGGLIKDIIELNSNILQPTLEPLKKIYDLCKECPTKLRAINTRFMNTPKNINDYVYFSMSKIKIPSDITPEEELKLKDVCVRLHQIMNNSRSKIFETDNNSRAMLQEYLNARKNKNKIIDDYFDTCDDELKRLLTSYITDISDDHMLVTEFQEIVKMRLLINQESRKCYKWLNNVVDTMLVQNRLYQLKDSTLSLEILHKIEDAYMDFNNYNKEAEMERLMKKINSLVSDPHKFKSYFKVAKLAKKCIENVNLIGYIERLYKELGISPPDFNWGLFKDKLIVFLVTDMIRVDVYVPKEIKGGEPNYLSENYSLLNMIFNQKWSADHIFAKNSDQGGGFNNQDYGNAVVNDQDFYQRAANLEYCNYIKNAGTQNTTIDLVYNAAGAGAAAPIYQPAVTPLNVFKKRAKLLKWNVPEDKIRGIDTLNIDRGARVKTWWVDVLKSGSTNNHATDIRLFTYGYSFRNKITDYYPMLKILPIKSFEAILTPIVQIMDKYISQRFNGNLDIKNTNVSLLMRGGNTENKIKGSSYFDIIEPHEVYDSDIIVEATEFYLGAYHILKFYTTFIENLKDEAKIKFFKASVLYRLKQLFGNKMVINNEVDLKKMISVFNEIWNSFNEPDIKLKTKKAIDLLINEINACMLFDQSEDVMGFKSTLDDFNSTDMFTFSFDRVYSMINNSIETIAKSIKQLTPNSVQIVEQTMKETTDKLNKAQPHLRIGILKNLFMTEKNNIDNVYMNFCEVCISPLAITVAYYIIVFNMLINNITAFDPEPVQTNSINVNGLYERSIDRFRRKYIEKIGITYNDEDQTSYLRTDQIYTGVISGIGKNSRLLAAYPEVYAANYQLLLKPSDEPDKDKESFFRILLEKIYRDYIQDVDQCIHNIMAYPGFTDDKLIGIKENFHDAFKSHYEMALNTISNIDLNIMSKICSFMSEDTNYIPICINEYTRELFDTTVTDLKYGFKPELINKETMRLYFANQDISYTKFVVIMLASQNNDYYLPQTFVQMLENSPLNGVTCNSVTAMGLIKRSDIQSSKPITLVLGDTPITNLILYLSHTDNAIAKTTTNLMNVYYVNSLISIIPFILSVLYRSTFLVKDGFTYRPNYLSGDGVKIKHIDARTEITLLSSMLIKLYNELLPLSSNIQFKDSMDLKIPHSFTELLYDFQNYFIDVNREQTFSQYEWINSKVNTELGINYDNYDRFALYKEKYINSNTDEHFKSQFETLITQLARLTMNRLMLTVKFPDTNHIKFSHNDATAINLLRGGFNNPLKGGVRGDYNKIINKIATNPIVLSLTGHFGFTESNLRTLFKKLYSYDFGTILNNLRLSVDLSCDSGVDENSAGHQLLNVFIPDPATAINRPSMSIMNVLHKVFDESFNNDIKNKEYSHIQYLRNEFNVLFDVGFPDFKPLLFSDNRTAANGGFLDKFITQATGAIPAANAGAPNRIDINQLYTTMNHFMNNSNNGIDGINKLYFASFLLMVFDVIRYFKVIDADIDYSTGVGVDENQSVQASIVYNGQDINNVFPTLLNRTATSLKFKNINPRKYKNSDQELTTNLINSIPNKTDVADFITRLRNPREYLKEDDVNHLMTGGPNLPREQAEAAVEYINSLSWNNYTLKELADHFKAGYDIGYYMFITTMLILANIRDDFTMMGVQKLFHSLGAQNKYRNIESFAVAYSGLLSNKLFDKPLVNTIENTVNYKNNLFSLYGNKLSTNQNGDIENSIGMSKLFNLIVGNKYKKSLDTNPYNLFAKVILDANSTKLGGYLSSYGLPTLPGISHYFPSSLEHCNKQTLEKIHDYYLGSRIMVGSNLLIGVNKIEDNHEYENPSTFSLYHTGKKIIPFNGIYNSHKFRPIYQTPFRQMLIKAGYEIKHTGNGGSTEAHLISAPGHQYVIEGHNRDYVAFVNIDFCANIYDSRTNTIARGNNAHPGANTGQHFFDVAVNPNIEFINDTNTNDGLAQYNCNVTIDNTAGGPGRATSANGTAATRADDWGQQTGAYDPNSFGENSLHDDFRARNGSIPKLFVKKARIARETTLYHCGILYGKYQQTIQNTVKNWNNYVNMCRDVYTTVLTDPGRANNNHGRVTVDMLYNQMQIAYEHCDQYELSKNEFFANTPILKGLESSEGFMTNYLMTAQPIFGHYRRLVKLTTQQDDYAAVYATEFIEDDNTYTCFINGRPLGFNLHFGNGIGEENDKKEMCFLICKLLGDKHNHDNRINVNYVASNLDHSMRSKYLYSANSQLRNYIKSRKGDLTNSILDVLMAYSIDKPYHINEFNDIDEKIFKKIPHHSSLISCVNLIIIRNITTNPELVVGFGDGVTLPLNDDIYYRTGNLNNALRGYGIKNNSNIAIPVNENQVNMDPFMYKWLRTVPSTHSGYSNINVGQPNDYNRDVEHSQVVMQQGAQIPFVSGLSWTPMDRGRTAINGAATKDFAGQYPAGPNPLSTHPQDANNDTELPVINNKSKVASTCITSENVKNSIQYGISVGQNLKTIFDNGFVEEMEKIFTKVNKYEYTFNDLKNMLINSYLCGIPVIGDKNKLNDWFRSSELFGMAFDTTTYLNTVNAYYQTYLIDVFTSSNILSLNQYNLFSKELQNGDKQLIDDMVKRYFQPDTDNTREAIQALDMDWLGGVAPVAFAQRHNIGTTHNQVLTPGMSTELVNCPNGNNHLQINDDTLLSNQDTIFNGIDTHAPVDGNAGNKRAIRLAGMDIGEKKIDPKSSALIAFRTYIHTYNKNKIYGYDNISAGIIPLIHTLVFRPEFNSNVQALIMAEITSKTFNNEYDQSDYVSKVSNSLTDLTTITATNAHGNDNKFRDYFKTTVTNTSVSLKYVDNYKAIETDPLLTKCLHSEEKQNYVMLNDNINLPKVYTINDFLINQCYVNYADMYYFGNGGRTKDISSQITKLTTMKDRLHMLAITETGDNYIEYSNPEFSAAIKKDLYDYAFEEESQPTGYQIDYITTKELTNNVFTILNQSLLRVEDKNGQLNRVDILDKITPDRNVIVGNMLGGYNNIYSNTLISDGTKNLIKLYYYEGSTPIYEKITPGAISQDTDFTNMIVSYYNKRMLSLKPVFDKYMYVEILYNSAILNHFITKTIDVMKDELNTPPVDSQLTNTLNYLVNTFNVSGNYNNYFEAGVGDYQDHNHRPVVSFNEGELKLRTMDPTIYQNIKLSPSEISRALRKIYDSFDDRRLEDQDRGIKDMFRSIGEKILELDKYIIFIGTLARFLKTFGYHSNEYNTTITYSKTGTVDITPIS